MGGHPRGRGSPARRHRLQPHTPFLDVPGHGLRRCRRLPDFALCGTDYRLVRQEGGPDVRARGGPRSFVGARIFEYYKAHGILTAVMGASFRNTGQIEALAGRRPPTISPDLLTKLAEDEGDLPRVMSAPQRGANGWRGARAHLGDLLPLGDEPGRDGHREACRGHPQFPRRLAQAGSGSSRSDWFDYRPRNVVVEKATVGLGVRWSGRRALVPPAQRF